MAFLKKFLLIFLTLVAIIIIVFSVLNDSGDSLISDGLEINTTYIGDSSELVSNLEISGELKKKQTVEIKTMLNENNKISINRSQEGGKLGIIVRNSKGEKLVEKRISDSQTFSFQSTAGEGSIQFVLYQGTHKILININEDEYK